MSKNSLDIENETFIQKFYHGKRIFLTGVTGCLGKAIIEKLLRVTKVEHFYLLVRSKKNKSIAERIEELFKDPIFNTLKANNINYREKITVICGDCSLPALGISQTDRDIITQNVDIVIHSAATVRLEEEFKTAININVKGTYEMLKLAQDIKNLKIFVHVSTAFSNSNRTHIKEEFSDCSITGEQVFALIDNLSEDDLNILTPKLIDDYPNTYTFTKSIAENIVKSFSGKMSLLIFRPGMIVPSYKEPMEGWIDNLYGPMGLAMAVLSGIIRIVPINDQRIIQAVPVDYCVNGLLTSASAFVHSEHKSIPIYNFIPDKVNSVRWSSFLEYGLEMTKRLPVYKSIWYPTCTLVYKYWHFLILSFFYHILLGTIIDCALFIAGKKPKLIKIYRKLHFVIPTLRYFMYRDFKFENKNTMELFRRQEETDKKLFMFDITTVDWFALTDVSAKGISMYVLKTNLNDTETFLKHYNRLKILHYVTLTIIYSLIIYALIRVSLYWLL